MGWFRYFLLCPPPPPFVSNKLDVLLKFCFATGVCYGEVGGEMDAETSGMLGNRVGSLFAGRSSFHPGEPRDSLAHMSNGLCACGLIQIT